MTEDSLLPFDLPAVSRKKVTGDFEGGSISSDGGLVLLRAAERRLGLGRGAGGLHREWRERVVHTLPAMPLRMFANRRLRRCAAPWPGPGAGERPRSLFPTHHEPSGERALWRA